MRGHNTVFSVEGHRRIAKLVPGSDWDRTDYYYTRRWQVVEGRFEDDQGTAAAVATDVKYQYVWGQRYIDAPIVRDEDTSDGSGGDLGKTGSGLDERLYYLTDANMNVTCLVKTGGDSVERYVYSPYGEVTVLDGDQDSGGDSYEWTVDADMAGAAVALNSAGSPLAAASLA